MVVFYWKFMKWLIFIWWEFEFCAASNKLKGTSEAENAKKKKVQKMSCFVNMYPFLLLCFKDSLIYLAVQCCRVLARVLFHFLSMRRCSLLWGSHQHPLASGCHVLYVFYLVVTCLYFMWTCCQTLKICYSVYIKKKKSRW